LYLIKKEEGTMFGVEGEEVHLRKDSAASERRTVIYEIMKLK
jgi:hypothetical protein